MGVPPAMPAPATLCICFFTLPYIPTFNPFILREAVAPSTFDPGAPRSPPLDKGSKGFCLTFKPGSLPLN